MAASWPEHHYAAGRLLEMGIIKLPETSDVRFIRTETAGLRVRRCSIDLNLPRKQEQDEGDSLKWANEYMQTTGAEMGTTFVEESQGKDINTVGF